MAEQAPQYTIREENPPGEMFANEKGDSEQAAKFLGGAPPKSYYNL